MPHEGVAVDSLESKVGNDASLNIDQNSNSIV